MSDSPPDEISNRDGGPRISVVIPSHGRVAGLGRALSSVLGQKYAPHELLVVDDTPEEVTRQQVERVSADFAVRYLAFPAAPGKGRPGRSRNHGAWAAKGGYLAFLDDDDVWDLDYLERVSDRLTSGEWPRVVVTQARISQGDRVFLGERLAPEDFVPGGSYYWGKGVTGSNMVVAREAFLASGGYDQTLSYAEDWELFARLIQSGYSPVFNPLPGVTQFIDGGDHLSSKSSKGEESLRNYLERYDSLLSAKDRRDIRRLIHIQGRRKDNSPAERAWHLVWQFILSTPSQRLGMASRMPAQRRMYQ